MIKRVLRWVGLVSLSLIVSGCDIHPDNETDLAARVALNLEALKDIQEVGFINQEQYNQFEKSLRESEEAIRGALSGSTSDMKYIGSALVSVNEDADGGSKIEEYLDRTHNGAVGFSDYATESINSIANIELYVLNTELTDTTTLDDILSSVNAYTNSDKSDFHTYLGDYFIPAIDEDGENVTITLPSVFAKTSGSVNNSELGSHFLAKGYRTFEVCDHKHSGEDKNCDGGNHTCFIKDENGDVNCGDTKKVKRTVDLATIRLSEVNPEFLDILRSVGSSNDPNYIFHNDSAGGFKMILLNYPVSYIESIEKVEDEYDTFETNIVTSEDMYINLKEGKLKRYEDGKYIDIIQDTSQLYLTDKNSIDAMKSAKSGNTVANELSGSSFLVSGKAETDVRTDLTGENTVNLEVGTVVLRDYIETVYMPDINIDNWIATGRKVRFERLDGSSTMPWLTYVDNAGHPYSEGYMPKIYIHNILENKSGAKGGSLFFNKLLPNSDYTEGLEEGTEGYEDSDDDGRIDSALLGDRLPFYYLEKIDLAFTMGGEFLRSDTLHSGTDVSPVIYCIKTDMSMFDSKLHSDWINGVDANNNLAWWNKWLRDNGIDYSIDLNESSDYFTGTYYYATDEDGYIQFDLATIEQLQTEIDDKKIADSNTLIRSLFIIVGMILMFYGLLLICAWAFDINLSVGKPLLGLLTFGKLVAVTEYIDTPDEEYVVDKKKVIMVNFSYILIISIIITMVGVTLTLFNVIGLLYKIIELLSSIVVAIDNLIF